MASYYECCLYVALMLTTSLLARAWGARGDAAVGNGDTLPGVACPSGMVASNIGGGVMLHCHYRVALLLPACAEDGLNNTSCDFWARRLAVTLLAVQHVNERNDVVVPQAARLPAGFVIEPLVLNSGFAPDVAIESVFEAKREGFVAIVGPSRSDVAVPVATFGHVFHWPQVSFGAITATLSDKTQFKYFARTTTTSASTAAAMAGVMKHYGWTKASIIFPNDEYGVDFLRKLTASISQLEGLTVELHSSSYISGDRTVLAEALQSTASSGSRLIIALLLNPDIGPGLEMADQLGIIGPGYVWFGGDVSYDYGLADLRADAAEEGDPYGPAQAALDRRLAKLKGAIKVSFEGKGPKWSVVNDEFRRIDSTTFQRWAADAGTPNLTLAAFTPQFFDEGLLAISSSTPALAYDAVWAVALGIAANHSTWQDADWQAQVGEDYGRLRAEGALAGILRTTLDGISGRVEFEPESGNRRVDEVVDLVFQYFDSVEGRYVTAGWYRSAEGVLDLDRPVLWSDGSTTPPSATPPVPSESSTRFILIAAVAVLGGLLLVFVVLMLVYRRSVEARIARAAELRSKRKGPPKQGAQVTLAITDIQGSTSLWDAHPNAMAGDVKLHHKVLRALLSKTFGYEVATEGDSFICAFHTPEDAICWAALVQLNLMLSPWSVELEDGGHDVLHLQVDWARLGETQLSPLACTAVDMLSGAVTRPGATTSTQHAHHQGDHHPVIPPLFPLSQLQLGEKLKAAMKVSPGDTLTIGSTSSSQQPSGRIQLPVFRGLRVRIGIHTGVATRVVTHSSTKRAVYDGAVLAVAKAISDTPCGGQIIMSGEALAAVGSMEALSSRISAHCGSWLGPDSGVSVLHLGAHRIMRPTSSEDAGMIGGDGNGDFKPQRLVHQVTSSSRLPQPSVGATVEASCGSATFGTAGGHSLTLETRELERLAEVVELVQVVPWALRGRAKLYPPPSTLDQTSAGFGEAPSAAGVTIVFAWADDLKAIKAWREETATKAEAMFVEALRQLLLMHNGYEVECEHGTLLLAFGAPLDALRWALAVQERLMELEWPPALLLHRGAVELHDPHSKRLIFRGLRCGMGMCTGDAQLMQPCPRTGRAEYFGPLMNHAARVAFAGSGGQILIHEHTMAAAQGCDGGVFPDSEVSDLGRHALKGIRGTVSIHQISPRGLASRSFPPLKTQTVLSSQRLTNTDSDQMAAVVDNEMFLLHATRLMVDETPSACSFGLPDVSAEDRDDDASNFVAPFSLPGAVNNGEV